MGSRRDDESHCGGRASCKRTVSILSRSTSTRISSVCSSGIWGHLGLYSFELRGSNRKPARKCCSRISTMISIRSKPVSRFQAFCSSSIRKRRNRSSLCVTASSLPRMHSRSRRQYVASIPLIILRASCSLHVGKPFTSNKIKKELSFTDVPAVQGRLHGCFPQSRFP